MDRKRKVTFHADVDSEENNKKQKRVTTESEQSRLHSGKYTLDSDEEDDEQDNVKSMNQDDLDGNVKE